MWKLLEAWSGGAEGERALDQVIGGTEGEVGTLWARWWPWRPCAHGHPWDPTSSLTPLTTARKQGESTRPGRRWGWAQGVPGVRPRQSGGARGRRGRRDGV